MVGIFPLKSRVCQNAISLDISGKRHIIYLYCLCWLVLIFHALHNICRGSHQILWYVFVFSATNRGLSDCQCVQMSNAAQLKASWMKSVVNCGVQNYYFFSPAWLCIWYDTFTHLLHFISSPQMSLWMHRLYGTVVICSSSKYFLILIAHSLQ